MGGCEIRSWIVGRCMRGNGWQGDEAIGLGDWWHSSCGSKARFIDKVSVCEEDWSLADRQSKVTWTKYFSRIS